MRILPGRAMALVGAQYGSEGKGAVAAHLAHEFDLAIRTGGPNAGHTIYHNGKKFVMRSIPCGWVNPECQLVIGPGAVLDTEVLREEIRTIEDAGYSIRNRLFIDERAHLIRLHHRLSENGTEGLMHEKIGSTGEGVGVCRMARLSRGCVEGLDSTVVGDVKPQLSHWAQVCDTVPLVNNCLDTGYTAILEGTQGFGLSLIHGTWPYVTSHDTNAAQLAADAGISPRRVTAVMLVARTFPIRVHGNSGPMNDEMKWEELGVEPETTTVTKKMRRIGYWDKALFKRAVTVNDPTSLAITFADYIDPKLYGDEKLTDPILEFIHRREREASARVVLVGTGPETIVDRGGAL